MSILDILVAGNKLLQEFYHETIKVYGREVADGYQTPAFFTEVVSSNYEYGTKNYATITPAFKITYFQTLPDSIDQLQKVEEIKELFGLKLAVGNRKIGVSGYDYDFVGEKNNILQITINLQTTVDFIGEPIEGYDVAEILNYVNKEE